MQEYCPCAHKCTNQLFTKRQYANIEVRRAGKKGFGLFTKSDIKEGDFIIEYIGEVLEEEEYLRRKDLYMATGSRHYYFMNVGNGEVIDAARKGNFGRFINHSCDPNCETQKWMVRGELTIGLFAIKDVPANTELTFDYNFERYGDKPLKCHCGSKLCRGFVGGVLEDDKELAVHAFEPEDASHDPVPIMLQAGQGNVQDIESILDRALTTPETKWDADLQNRVKQIAEQVGHNWEMLFGEGEGKAEEEEEEHKPVHKYVEPVAVEVKQEVGEEEAEEMQELAFRGPPKFNLKKKKKLQQQLQLRQEQQQQQQQQEEQQQETDSDAEDAMPDRQKTEETKVKAAAAKAGSTDLTQFALKSKHGSFFDLSAEGDSGGGSEKQAQRARMVKLRELQAKIREKKLKEQMAKERERRERLNELDDSIIKRARSHRPRPARSPTSKAFVTQSTVYGCPDHVFILP
jgi:histone-lysine N-methyltransferase SETD2